MNEFVSYDRFEIQPHANRVVYWYSFNDEHHFQTAILIDLGKIKTPEDLKRIEGTVFCLGLCLLSYVYVAFCPPLIRVRAGRLETEQLPFWKALYEESLVEHFYVHQIDFGDGIEIVCDATATRKLERMPARSFSSPRVLVPLGCGKDSTLLFEMLKAQGIQPSWIYFEEFPGEFQQSWRYAGLARLSGTPDVFLCTHDFLSAAQIEPLKRFSNIKDYVLYPCVYAFASVLASIMHGFDHIAVGNERSANFGNLLYAGRTVNHQFEKSFRYEEMFHKYVRAHLVEDLHYFSGLQQLWELQIVERFCRYTQYLPVFMSCNEPMGSRWCARCPKCAQTFILLSAFLEPDQAWSVFGDNLFEDRSLFPIFEELMGLGKIKPLECVCTPEEVLAALNLARQKQKPGFLPEFFRAYAVPVEAGAAHLSLLHDSGASVPHLRPAWYKPL